MRFCPDSASVRFISPARCLRCWLFLLLSLCSFAAGAAPLPSSVPQFWEKEISDALDGRDNYFQRIGLDTSLYKTGNLSSETRQTIGRNLMRFQELENPWFNFLSGMLLEGQGGSGRNSAVPRYIDMYFSKALALAEQDPGLTWALLGEFHRFKIYLWENKCLSQMEKLFLSAGAQRSPLLAQQLLYYAVMAEKDDPEQAERYQDWARQFDPNQPWSLIRKMWLHLLSNPPVVISTFSELLKLIGESWPLQIVFLADMVQWLHKSIAIAVMSLLILLGIKHAGKSLHAIADLFPAAVPPRLRQFYSMSMFFACGFFGMVPFLWALMLLIWRYLSGAERALAGVCIAFLIAAPLGDRVESMFQASLNSGASLSLFRASLDEGYSPGAAQIIRINAAKHPDDYLAQLAAANFAVKASDILSAQEFIAKAERLSPQDPVVILTAGNIYYYAQDSGKANDYFSRCIKMFPELEATFFNPCLYYFGEMKIMEGMNLIESAGKLNPGRISSFIKKNDDYFSGEWPRLRHVLQPDYKSIYFWKTVFPRYWGTWKNAESSWGASSLGLNPVGYWILCVALTVILIRTGRNSGVKKIFFCKLCGVPICRKCKAKEYCAPCYESVEHIPDQTIMHQILTKASLKRYRTRIVVPNAISMLFPGMGPLYANESLTAGPLLLALLSSAIYAVYVTAHAITFAYPLFVAGGLFWALLAPCFGYTIFFLINGILAIRKGWKGS